MTTTKRDWKAHSLEGVFLRFIVHENRKVGGVIMHDWVLLKAKALGIHGGCAFRGIAGFGRHGILHEQTFWELSGELPVEICFVCSEEEAYRLLDVVEEARALVGVLRALAGPLRHRRHRPGRMVRGHPASRVTRGRKRVVPSGLLRRALVARDFPGQQQQLSRRALRYTD